MAAQVASSPSVWPRFGSPLAQPCAGGKGVERFQGEGASADAVGHLPSTCQGWPLRLGTMLMRMGLLLRLQLAALQQGRAVAAKVGEHGSPIRP